MRDRIKSLPFQVHWFEAESLRGGMQLKPKMRDTISISGRKCERGHQFEAENARRFAFDGR